MGKPKVLFVCVHNAGRSRMAESYFNLLAGDRYEGISAGTEPAASPHPEVIASMSEVGIELSGPARRLTPALAESATRVIGMGCDVEQACPALHAPIEDWELPDPRGKSPEELRAIRNRIKSNVEALIAELDAERGAG